jgi:hypothetical protein
MGRDDKGFGRRGFLARVFAGGVGTAFALDAPVAARPVAETCKASAADAFVLSTELLGEVLGDAIYNASKPPLQRAKVCAEGLEKLNAKLGELERELRGPKGEPANRVRELVNTGRLNVQLLREAVGKSDERVVALVGVLNSVHEGLDEAAKEVEEKCKFGLTDKGRTLLSEAVKLAQEYKPAAAAVDAGQKAYHDNVLQLQCAATKARHAISRAATASSEGNLALMDAEVDRAVSQMKTLDPSVKDPDAPPTPGAPPEPDDPPTPDASEPSPTPTPEQGATGLPASGQTDECKSPERQQRPSGSAAQVLVELLRGGQKLARNPDVVNRLLNASATRGRGERPVMFVRASARSAPAVPLQDYGTLLSNYCEPDSWGRRILLASGVGAAWLQHPDDRGKRLKMIRWVIYELGCEGRSEVSTLAGQLA